jgi:putative hydrolase of the HAD superfamily
MHRIKAVLFDLDNTLIDFTRMKSESVRAAARAMARAGLRVPPEKIEGMLWTLYQEHGIEYQKVFQKLLRATIGRIDYRILSAGIIAYRSAKQEHLHAFPRTQSVLKELQKRGYKLGVVSNAPRMQAWTRLTQAGLADFFQSVTAFEDVRVKKPHYIPFHAAARKLALTPDKILFVGDSLQRDVIGAKKAGMRAAWARYGFETARKSSMVSRFFEKKTARNLARAKPDFVLNKFGDLLDVVPARKQRK